LIPSETQSVEIYRSRGELEVSEIEHELVVNEEPEVSFTQERENFTTVVDEVAVVLQGEVEVVERARPVAKSLPIDWVKARSVVAVHSGIICSTPRVFQSDVVSKRNVDVLGVTIPLPERCRSIDGGVIARGQIGLAIRVQSAIDNSVIIGPVSLKIWVAKDLVARHVGLSRVNAGAATGVTPVTSAWPKVSHKSRDSQRALR